MIVNHRYKFIFLKTSKTAGSSTEAFLRKYCKRGDVVTSLNHNDEQEIRSFGSCLPTGHKKISRRASLKDYLKIVRGDKKAIRHERQLVRHVARRPLT